MSKKMESEHKMSITITSLINGLHKALKEGDSPITIHRKFIEDLLEYLDELKKMRKKLNDFIVRFLNPMHNIIFGNNYPNESSSILIERMIQWSENDIKNQFKSFIGGK